MTQEIFESTIWRKLNSVVTELLQYHGTQNVMNLLKIKTNSYKSVTITTRQIELVP